LLSFFAATFSFAQNCSQLFISEYVEGSGNNKALEIYNPTASAIDLSGYRIERFSNGSGTSAAGGVLNLSGSIAANSAFVIANGQITTSTSSPACDPILQAMADQLDGVYPAPTYMNGNDAIALFNGSIMIDLLGKTGQASITSSSGWGDVFPYDGSVGAVWTENHTLVRKATVQIGVSANPTTFIVSNEWDSLPQNTWSNLGTHVCSCISGISDLANSVSFVIYPNPSADGLFNISSSESLEFIEVVNILGQVVIREKKSSNTKLSTIDSSLLTKGIYSVRLYFSDASIAQANIIIQ
ncbi:MAG: T9SS C-terminal target domain-containing protein, partial [Flavobacteriia bacterium]|nr:T9SS C-terminal target domain-containing protein [Flavobacteriia bacterium]